MKFLRDNSALLVLLAGLVGHGYLVWYRLGQVEQSQRDTAAALQNYVTKHGEIHLAILENLTRSSTRIDSLERRP